MSGTSTHCSALVHSVRCKWQVQTHHPQAFFWKVVNVLPFLGSRAAPMSAPPLFSHFMIARYRRVDPMLPQH